MNSQSGLIEIDEFTVGLVKIELKRMAHLFITVPQSTFDDVFSIVTEYLIKKDYKYNNLTPHNQEMTRPSKVIFLEVYKEKDPQGATYVVHPSFILGDLQKIIPQEKLLSLCIANTIDGMSILSIGTLSN